MITGGKGLVSIAETRGTTFNPLREKFPGVRRDVGEPKPAICAFWEDAEGEQKSL